MQNKKKKQQKFTLCHVFSIKRKQIFTIKDKESQMMIKEESEYKIDVFLLRKYYCRKRIEEKDENYKIWVGLYISHNL